MTMPKVPSVLTCPGNASMTSSLPAWMACAVAGRALAMSDGSSTDTVISNGPLMPGPKDSEIRS